MDTMRLLLSCRDRRGIVAKVTGFLAQANLNIIDLDQHSDGSGQLHMRVVFERPANLSAIASAFRAQVAADLEARASFSDGSKQKRIALLASKTSHCLLDVLWRTRTGELDAEVEAVISNHPDHRSEVEFLGVPYHEVSSGPSPDPAAEEEILELIAGRVQLVVLARYMRILSPEFLDQVSCPVINIHHSFLPAFAGARPHLAAWERGVKLIGATAHYATAELDAGPIIVQDTASVTHRDEISDLERIGRDLERMVLARALRAHLEDRVIQTGGRTVVF